MPRKSSSSRTSRTPKKVPTKFQGDSTPVNSHPQPTFGSAVTQGVGLGAGVAIGSTMANSAANAIFGNNNTSNPSNLNNDNLNENNQHTFTNTFTNTFDNFTKVNNCLLEYNDLKKCMVENNGNIEFCKVYQEMLNICRKDVVL